MSTNQRWPDARSTRNRALLLALVLASACGGGTVGTSVGQDGGTASPGMDGMVASAGLQIVSLTATVSTLFAMSSTTDSDMTTFIAIVTDDSGLDAIAGGSLLDDQGSSYAAFGAAATKGTYTASVTWTDINRVRSIQFDVAPGARTFVAKFFDNAGRVTTTKLPISFRCGSSSQASSVSVCGGECFSETSDPSHCGSCSTVCNPVSFCSSSTCAQDPGVPSCFTTDKVPLVKTCGDVCAGLGKSCTAGYRFANDASCSGNRFRFDCTVALQIFQSDRFFSCDCQ